LGSRNGVGWDDGRDFGKMGAGGRSPMKLAKTTKRKRKNMNNSTVISTERFGKGSG
jgi:hypothetical protein